MNDKELFGNSEQLEKDHVADTGNMVGDSISRATAIETVRKAKSIGQAHRMLVQLPSAQQWIPVTERLPGDVKDVIVSVRYGSGGNAFEYSSFGWYSCADNFWIVNNESNERVVAWTPLPEPYKEHTDDHN